MTANSEHISRLQEAQDLLREALGILRDVARETNNRNAEAYIIPDIEMTIDSNHDWLGRHANVQEWIDELSEDDEPEDTDAAPLYDQPSFPHAEAYALDTREGVRIFGASIEARVHMYAYRHDVSTDLARAAIRFILEEA